MPIPIRAPASAPRAPPATAPVRTEPPSVPSASTGPMPGISRAAAAPSRPPRIAPVAAPAPGKEGGARFVRRDEHGHFTTDQVDVGRSLAADRRQQAKHQAPKGQKNRGD